jgi:hypothetical protein
MYHPQYPCHCRDDFAPDVCPKSWFECPKASQYSPAPEWEGVVATPSTSAVAEEATNGKERWIEYDGSNQNQSKASADELKKEMDKLAPSLREKFEGLISKVVAEIKNFTGTSATPVEVEPPAPTLPRPVAPVEVQSVKPVEPPATTLPRPVAPVEVQSVKPVEPVKNGPISDVDGFSTLEEYLSENGNSVIVGQRRKLTIPPGVVAARINVTSRIEKLLAKNKDRTFVILEIDPRHEYADVHFEGDDDNDAHMIPTVIIESSPILHASTREPYTDAQGVVHRPE